MKDYPMVCANCKWAQMDTSEDSERYGHGSWCHYYPGNHHFVNEFDWCSKFALINPGVRPVRYDLPLAPYQTHVAQGRFER